MLTAVNAGLGALSDARLQAIVEAEGPDARTASRARAQRSAIVARLLVGRVLCVTLAGAMAGYAWLTRGGIGQAVIAVVVVALLYSFLATVTTTLARQRSRRLTLGLLRWARPLEWVFAPIAAPLDWLSRLIQKGVPLGREDNPERVAELAVGHIIDKSEQTGSIAEDQANMLRSVLEFKNTVVREIMVPRTKIVAFSIDTPLDELAPEIIASGHSRYPIYRDQVDHIEGLLYAKDLFQVLDDPGRRVSVKLSELVRRPAFFASETQKIGDLLREMQVRKLHLAVVVDEFGGASGIVTLEDIVEEIVGDIQDEYDKERPRVQSIGPGRYIVDAGVSIYDLEDAIKEEICEDKDGFETLGGWLVQIAGHVPQVGERLVAGPYGVRVLSGDDRKIALVEMARSAPADLEPPKAAVG